MNKKLIAAMLILFLFLAILISFAVKKGKSSLRIPQTSGSSPLELLAQAKEFEKTGNLPGAKSAYQKLISVYPSAKDILAWQKKLEELNIRILFSPILGEQAVLYEIKPGDTLNKIAAQFKTTVELIMKSNNLTSDRIVPRSKVRIWTAPFSVLVDKSQNILTLRTNNEIIKTYTVATGINNSTPVGTFKIINKLPNPTWFQAGAVFAAGSPKNVLGSRWLGFDLPRYGIHGTTDPQSLGRQATQGCVRMSNSDVEELYSIVPVGTEVTIVD